VNIHLLDDNNTEYTNMTVNCEQQTWTPILLVSTLPAVLVVHFPEVVLTEAEKNSGVLGWFQETQLQFSFHSDTSFFPPESGGKWVCSDAAQYRDVHQHLGCNLRSECVGGEDESQCTYSSQRCGPGLLDIFHNDTYCYLYEDF
jgi:hypothetical protein